MLPVVWAPAWGALPSPGVSTPAQLGSPLPLLWTPMAEITIGAPEPVPGVDYTFATGGAPGPFYVLKAPADGILEYLYSWTSFFAAGEPMVRFYDAQLLPDLRKAKAIAGKFNAQPFIIAGLAARSTPVGPLALGFPSPTLTPAPLSSVLPAGPPPASPAPSAERPRASLERTGQPATSRARLSPARAELAAAQKRLAETEQELAARRQLQESGVLATEEVTRFETARREAQASVKQARQSVQEAEATARPAETTGPPPARHAVAPMARPAAPALSMPPAELQRLTTPRWVDLFAPTGGLVVAPVVPPGTTVKRGAPVLKVVNSAWARLRVVVPAEQALRFDRSVPVTINFPEVPGLRFGGWVTGKQRLPGDNRVVVEMQVTRPDEPDETQSVLMAMAYASPPAQDASELELAPKAARAATASGRLFGLVPAMMVAGKAQEDAAGNSGPLVGRLALVPPVPRFGPPPCPDPKLQDNLKQLHDWQSSFADGMTTAIYNQKLLLSYPREGEISQAVEKMIKSEVEHDPGYCARTLRLALGWGLGDAYNWAVQLPQRGWRAREDGLPRPGDILVWPFTYGRNHSQHIGVAVRQNERMMLLSNLEGRLGTSELVGGYIAFYKPTTPASPSSVPPPPATHKR